MPIFKLILQAILAALLGAVIGAVGLFILSEGLPEGAIMGAVLGGSIGMLIAARINALRAGTALQAADPAAAKRSAALLSAREGQIRDFHRDARSNMPVGNPSRKLDDLASRAEERSRREEPRR